MNKGTKIFIGLLTGLFIALVYLLVARQNIINSCEWTNVTIISVNSGGVMPDYQVQDYLANNNYYTIEVYDTNTLTPYRFEVILDNFPYSNPDQLEMWICEYNGETILGDLR